MNWISTRMRISIGLACLTLSVLLLSMLIGVMPDRDKAVLEGRRALCEAIAVNSSLLVSQQDVARLQSVMAVTAERNREIVSAGLRREDGELLVDVGDHRRHWKPLTGDRSIETQVLVPIRAGERRWGNVEICFQPLGQSGLTALFLGDRARMLCFVSGLCFLLFFYYMKKMLEYLDPSQAVPGHVRSALDTLAEGLLVIDGRDRIVLANGAFARMVGKSPDKLLGHVASRLPWVGAQEDQPPAMLPWTVALREKNSKTNDMLRLRTVAGQVRTFIVNSSPVLGTKGEYRGVLATFDDVTDLEEKESALRKAVEAADAANRTKSEFLANMSHEIRTPMNTILGFADVLRRGLAQNPSDAAQYLNTIHSSGKHLLELINDILDLSKIESGRLDIERKPLEPLTMLAELVDMFSVPARQRGLTLELDAEGPLPRTIQSDPTRLRQIVTNLVGNALKFTEKGGVRVAVRLERKGWKQWFVIEVRDTGIGIAPHSLGKIFDPFVQADNTVTRRFGGTGLGLAICRRFADAMGGELTVSSTLGRGSTFCLALDPGLVRPSDLIDGRQALADRKLLPAASEGVARLPPGRVLVADDGEANRQLITVILRRAGMEVEGVGDGAAAVQAASAGRFDLILMDMQMPVMDGYTATSRLRSQGCTLPIVALTANAMMDDEDKCREAGCSAFLAKPLDIDKLLACLAQQLAGRELVAGMAIGCQRHAEPHADVPVPAMVNTHLDDPEFRPIIAGYVVRLHEQHAAMQAARDRNDWSEIASLAHWLKGSAGTVGFPAFTQPAAELEAAAKRDDATQVQEHLATVARLIASIQLPSDMAVAETARELEELHV